MGDFDKKKAFSIGGVLAGITSVIAVLANMSEIAQFFNKDDKLESSSTSASIVEESDEETEKNIVIEQAEDIEEDYAEEVEEVPPTEPQPSVVYLDSLKAAESSYNFFVESNGSNIDSVGNTYIGHVLITSSSTSTQEINAYAIYYLGGKYKTLSGTLAISDLSDSQPICEFLVSCDDNVVYTTGQVGRATAPMEISLDVENCQWLKLSGALHSSWKGSIKFLLYDWKLEE